MDTYAMEKEQAFKLGPKKQKTTKYIDNSVYQKNRKNLKSFFRFDIL